MGKDEVVRGQSCHTGKLTIMGVVVKRAGTGSLNDDKVNPRCHKFSDRPGTDPTLLCGWHPKANATCLDAESKKSHPHPRLLCVSGGCTRRDYLRLEG